MAVGRLNRETNPMPGEKPGFLPQHELADGSFQTTGVNNPLPVGNYVQNDSGLWVPVSQSNPMPTQLTGSNVELLLDEKTIPAGGFSQQRNIEVVNFKQFIVGVHEKDELNHDFQVDISWLSSNDLVLEKEIGILKIENYHRGATNYNPVKGHNMVFFIVNKDTIEHSYSPVLKLSKF